MWATIRHTTVAVFSERKQVPQMLMVPSLNANEVGVYIVGNICSKVKQAFRLV